jgi:hypothetical protein
MPAPVEPPTLETIDGHLTVYASALRRFLESARCAGTKAEGMDPESPWSFRQAILGSSLNRALAQDLLALDSASRRFYEAAVLYSPHGLTGFGIPYHVNRTWFAVLWSHGEVLRIATRWGIVSRPLVVPADWWLREWWVETAELKAMQAALAMIEGKATEGQVEATLPPTLAQRFAASHRQGSHGATFLEFMETRTGATFVEIGDAVYGDDCKSSNAITKMVGLVCKWLIEEGSTVSFACGSGRVTKMVGQR